MHEKCAIVQERSCNYFLGQSLERFSQEFLMLDLRGGRLPHMYKSEISPSASVSGLLTGEIIDVPAEMRGPSRHADRENLDFRIVTITLRSQPKRLILIWQRNKNREQRARTYLRNVPHVIHSVHLCPPLFPRLPLPRFVHFSLSFSFSGAVFFSRYPDSLALSFSVSFPPNLLPLVHPASPLRSRCSSIFATLSLWLARRCFSTLLLRSLALSLPHTKSFLVSLFSVPLLFGISLILFSALLAPLSSPSLPFRSSRLHSHDTFSALLSLAACRSAVCLARVLLLFFHAFTTAKGLLGLLCP